MRFSVKITSICVWVAIPVDWVILHWFCGADWLSGGGWRSRDYHFSLMGSQSTRFSYPWCSASRARAPLWSRHCSNFFGWQRVSQRVLEHNLLCFSLSFFFWFSLKASGRVVRVIQCKTCSKRLCSLISPWNHTSGVGNLQSSLMKSQVHKTINSSS